MDAGRVAWGLSLVVGCQVSPDGSAAGPRPLSLAEATTPPPVLQLDPSPSPPASRCPDDMVEVKGLFCTELEHHCVEERQPWQCATYADTSRCVGDERELHVCIDRYEAPNRRGVAPALMVSWLEAQASCEAAGKRLCTEDEWTLACEGPGRWPFPYGYVRDAARCNIDRPTRYVILDRLFNPFSQPEELARVAQHEPAGSRPGCVSAFGVHDLTGNADEWVRNESGRPHASSLKGGNWEQHRNACRPRTRGHQPGFAYYPTGFRCCRDPR